MAESRARSWPGLLPGNGLAALTQTSFGALIPEPRAECFLLLRPLTPWLCSFFGTWVPNWVGPLSQH